MDEQDVQQISASQFREMEAFREGRSKGDVLTMPDDADTLPEGTVQEKET